MATKSLEVKNAWILLFVDLLRPVAAVGTLIPHRTRCYGQDRLYTS